MRLWGTGTLLDPDSIGPRQQFFPTGGRLDRRYEACRGELQENGITAHLADLFRQPEVDQLTSLAFSSASSSPTSIPRVDHIGPVEQSFAQARLWFLEQLHLPFHLMQHLIPFAVRVFQGTASTRITEPRTTGSAESRQERCYRTIFSTNGEANVQQVQPFYPKALNIVDILPGDMSEHDLLSAVQKDQTTPFDLRSEPGLGDRRVV